MIIGLRETAKILEDADDMLLLPHVRPDGDALGSSCALARALSKAGKRVRVELPGAVSKEYDFMFEELENPDFEPKFVSAIDVADVKLLGSEAEAKYAGKIDLCIDHHASNALFANKTFLEASSASAAEMVFLLLEEMKLEIDPKTASRLFAGVATDTGGFRFSNVTARTFEIAARLTRLGADTYNIIRTFFETKTKTYAALERLALDDMRFYFSDRCALICATKETYAKSGSNESETDRLADLPRQIEGTLVGVAMRELEDGGFKVSVRTHGDVDASAICKRLGGGGHRGAAGCTVYASKERAINLVLDEIGAELDARQKT